MRMLVSRNTLDIVQILTFPTLALQMDIGPIHQRKTRLNPLRGIVSHRLLQESANQRIHRGLMLFGVLPTRFQQVVTMEMVMLGMMHLLCAHICSVQSEGGGVSIELNLRPGRRQV